LQRKCPNWHNGFSLFSVVGHHTLKIHILQVNSDDDVLLK
jgi:hypothetical protein